MRFEYAAHEHQLAEVVGVVIGREQDLAEDGLAVAVRNLRVEVDGFIACEVDECAQISTELRDALVPRCIVGRRDARRPIAGWELGRNVLRVPREFQNVPLRDTQVLEQLPGGMGAPLRPLPAPLRRKVLHRVVESNVSVTSVEELGEVVAKRTVSVVHRTDRKP